MTFLKKLVLCFAKCYNDAKEVCPHKLTKEDKAMYMALDVARYCLWYCAQIKRPLSNLQLQKILYYIQARFLVERGQPCFREPIVAWKLGPVVVPVYNHYRDNVAEKIYERAYNSAATPLQADAVRDINSICHTKSRHEALDLAWMSHDEEPWKITWDNEAGRNSEIPQALIADFFMQNRDRFDI